MSEKPLTNRRKLLCLTSAAMVLLLTACGSSGGTSSGSGSTAATKATKSPVNVMLLVTLNSATLNEPEAIAGAQAAAKAINGDGGIQGHPINIVTCNDQFNANQAAACARQAVSGHDLAVIPFSNFGSSFDPILTQASIPSVANALSEPADYTDPTAFPINPGGTAEFMACVAELAATGHTRIAIGDGATPIVAQVLDGVQKAVSLVKTPSGGALTFVGRVNWPLTATDFSPYAEAVVSDKADGVVIVSTPQEDVSLASALNQQGVTEQNVALCNIQGDMPPSEMKDVSSGFEVIGAYPSASTATSFPGIRKFQQQMAAAAGAGVANASPADYDESSLTAWLGIYAIDDVASKITGNLEAASLLAALKRTCGVNLQGILTAWSPCMAGKGPKLFPDMFQGDVFFEKDVNGSAQLVTKKPFNVVPMVTQAFGS
jgi:ABC-type branched-subunit amino acid transport system substrate-binding protein